MPVKQQKGNKTEEDTVAKVERALLSSGGVFQRLPFPKFAVNADTEGQVRLWRAVLDLCFLDLLRGPVSPYPGHPQSVKETRNEYNKWVHWLYGDYTKDFYEVCDLAGLDPVMVKNTITKYVRMKRDGQTDGG